MLKVKFWPRYSKLNLACFLACSVYRQQLSVIYEVLFILRTCAYRISNRVCWTVQVVLWVLNLMHKILAMSADSICLPLKAHDFSSLCWRICVICPRIHSTSTATSPAGKKHALRYTATYSLRPCNFYTKYHWYFFCFGFGIVSLSLIFKKTDFPLTGPMSSWILTSETCHYGIKIQLP